MITSTVAALLQEYFKTPERSVFWDDALKVNVDPFQEIEGSFFAASWDTKVRYDAFPRTLHNVSSAPTLRTAHNTAAIGGIATLP